MRGYKKVMYWLELANDSMISLIYRLNCKFGGGVWIDRYNWCLLDTVKDRVTTEEDIVVEAKQSTKLWISAAKKVSLTVSTMRKTGPIM